MNATAPLRLPSTPPAGPPPKLGHPYYDAGRALLVWPVPEGHEPEVRLGVDQGRAVAWLAASRWAPRARVHQNVLGQQLLRSWEATPHADGARLRLVLSAPAELIPGWDSSRKEWLLAIRPKAPPPPSEALPPSGQEAGPMLVSVGGNPEGPLRLSFAGPPPLPLVQRLGPEDTAAWWLGARLGPDAPRMGRSAGPGLPAWWALEDRPEGVLVWVRHAPGVVMEARAFPSSGAGELRLMAPPPSLEAHP